MNLRHNEPKQQEVPWYHQPESVTPPTVSTTLPVEKAKLQPVHYERDQAERILARAGALQEIHGQLLSLEQIEAIASEIGIKPEFVHLALEQEAQESHAALSAPQTTVAATETLPVNLARRRVVSTIVASALVAAMYAAVASMKGEPGGLFLILTLCAFPLFLSLTLGWLSRSRRWGSVSGLALAITAITACQAISYYQGDGVSWDAFTLRVFAIAIASSTFLGATGAQARRWLKRRVVE